MIEHGHQYDPYCLCIDPINPIIKKNKKFKIRLPFGNLANRFILNQFGLKNPHHDESFVKTGLEFLVFFLKYELKVQPFLVFNWLFGSLRTMKCSLEEAFRPAVKDPLTYDEKIKNIAKKSNASINAVLALKELHAHPAVHNPIQIIRELWLDRFFLLILFIWGYWQMFTTLHLFANLSLWWFLGPVFITIPLLGYYAQKIKSEVHLNSHKGRQKAPIASKIVRVKRVVHGHTHFDNHEIIDDIEFINPGSWSPYFDDLECTKNKRIRKYVWITWVNQSRSAKLIIY